MWSSGDVSRRQYPSPNRERTERASMSQVVSTRRSQSAVIKEMKEPGGEGTGLGDRRIAGLGHLATVADWLRQAWRRFKAQAV
jgi:hypothetical protein